MGGSGNGILPDQPLPRTLPHNRSENDPPLPVRWRGIKRGSTYGETRGSGGRSGGGRSTSEISPVPWSTHVLSPHTLAALSDRSTIDPPVDEGARENPPPSCDMMQESPQESRIDSTSQGGLTAFRSDSRRLDCSSGMNPRSFVHPSAYAANLMVPPVVGNRSPASPLLPASFGH